MLPIRCILVGTDFSPEADVAFQAACELAQQNNSRLIVFHAAGLLAVGEAGTVPYPIPPDPNDSLELIEARLRQIKSAVPGVEPEFRIERGPAGDAIVHAARQESSDLIVIGAGRTGISRMVMGSVAEKVARAAACPVLIVKNPAD